MSGRGKGYKKVGNRNYRQVEVEGANHFFPGNEAVLVGHVIEWLDQQAK